MERCPPAVLAGLLQGIDVSRPILQGRVFKQFRSETGFNKRYFVLYPGILVYYKHERDYRSDIKRGLVRTDISLQHETSRRFPFRRTE